MKRARLALALVAAAGLACNESPSGPTLLPGGSAGNGTLTGVVVNQNGGAPIAGATVLLAGVPSVTDAQGRFRLATQSSGSGVVSVGVTGFLFRGVAVALAASRPDLRIDLIQDTPPFDLQFYRWFARDGYERLDLQPINPWTMAPSFYLKLIVEDSGVRVSDAVVNGLRELFAKTVPALSGGRFQMAAFETGDAARPLETGWVNITFYASLGAAFGQSTVGGNSGTIAIRYGMVSTPSTNPFGCATPEIGVADHEVTHTMGYWHTPNVFVDTFSGQGCPGTWPAHVRHHATVMYSRPPGNRDPDVDPATLLNLQAASIAPRATVSCSWR